MAGGLIQIASYGIHDIFLIGNPQITFFKIVYRRHSNFSMEYIEEQFSGNQNFGGYLSCNLSKAGDLLHKLYLKIAIPQVLINKSIYSNQEQNIVNPYNTYLANYNQIQIFINSVNYNIIQPLYKLLKISNLKYNEINSKYNISLNRMNYTTILDKIKNIKIVFNKTFNVLLYNGTASIIYINDQTNISTFIDFNNYYIRYVSKLSTAINSDLKLLLDNYSLQLEIIKKNMYDMLLFYQNINNIMLRQNINFSWVEYLGQQIINRAEVEIGGKVIDFTDAVRMNINYQLTNKIMHDMTYDKIIGNVPEMTTFNDIVKPAYIMYIPLDFWFSKYSGLSLPLIYLRFHDVKINIKLNDLVNCCYYEYLNEDYLIEDIIKLDSATLIVNYIYLDTDERNKFAQLSQEYLIDQTQVGEFTDINHTKLNIELPFFNPVKQLFWVVRDNNTIAHLKYFDYSSNYYVDIYNFESSIDPSLIDKNSLTARNLIKIKTVETQLAEYINVGDIITIYNSIYYNGIYSVIKIDNEYLYIQYDYFMKEEYLNNYDLIISNGYSIYTQSLSYSGNSQAYICKIININPIQLSSLQINGVDRFYKVNDIYSNFVQPYQNNSRSPSFGLNTYSFALYPEEYQPSGFCNYNKLDLKIMILDFNPIYINNNTKKSLNVLIYAHSYNILNLSYGKAGIILNI